MFYVSEVSSRVPDVFKTPLQEKVYRVLAELSIPFFRVDTDEAITMDDCLLINEKLDMKMVKTLFLCNRQKTDFYLFITCADKLFRSKEFSNALGIPRVSFAPAEMMTEMLGTKIGAATVFSVLLNQAKDVQIVFDGDVLKEEWYGCSDGTTTGYMKIAADRVLGDILPYAGKTFKIVEL